MRLLNKRGIELAASTVVMLIVAVTILVLAVSLTYRVTCAADDYRLQVDSQAEKQVERLLTTGGTIVLADNSKTAKSEGSALCGASSQRAATFTLGLRNPETAPLTYHLTVYDSAGSPAEEVRLMGDEDLGTASAKYRLTAGENRVVPILILAPKGTDAGTYEYTLQVQGIDNAVRILYLVVE